MSESAFKIVGVDLAAAPENTAYCVICVEGGNACVHKPESGATDEKLLEVFSERGVARIGFDAPFGWPHPFVSALRSHARHNVWPRDRRRKDRHFADLTLRATDVHVEESVDNVTPLSVSASWIAVVAMRAALLLSRAPESLEVDRSGVNGNFVEVYPAAALAAWFNKGGADWSTGYKGEAPSHREKRHDIVRKLVGATKPGLALGDATDPLDSGSVDIRDKTKDRRETVARLIQSDDALDALISALVTLMAEVDRRTGHPKHDPLIESVPPARQALAEIEGWIALPTDGSLERLPCRLESLASDGDTGPEGRR